MSSLNTEPEHKVLLIFRKKFFFLFIALMVPYLVHPLANSEFQGISLLDISFSLVLIMGVFAVSSQRRVAMIALGLVILTQGLTWTTHLMNSDVLILPGVAMDV